MNSEHSFDLTILSGYMHPHSHYFGRNVRFDMTLSLHQHKLCDIIRQKCRENIFKRRLFQRVSSIITSTKFGIIKTIWPE